MQNRLNLISCKDTINLSNGKVIKSKATYREVNASLCDIG